MAGRFVRQARKVAVTPAFTPVHAEAWLLDDGGQAHCGDCGKSVTTLFIYGGDILCWPCAAYRNPDFARAEMRYAQDRAQEAAELVQKLEQAQHAKTVFTEQKAHARQNISELKPRRKR